MPARKVTSIKIDADLWKEVKIRCIEEGREISTFVEENLRKALCTHPVVKHNKEK